MLFFLFFKINSLAKNWKKFLKKVLLKKISLKRTLFIYIRSLEAIFHYFHFFSTLAKEMKTGPKMDKGTNFVRSISLRIYWNRRIYRVFRINIPSLISVIGQRMGLTCVMVSIPQKSEGLRCAILKISSLLKPVTLFENS